MVTRETAPRAGRADLAWRLLGIHATRLDIANRDIEKDEALDLNCAWYADILMTLTQSGAARPAKA